MPRLLLVDDDPALLEILGDYLSRAEHEIQTATSGDDALRKAAEAPPDLVVLDVSMPRKDGWDVLRALRASSAVPVIMLTAKTEEQDVLRGFSLGADDYVSKPFSCAQLQARIGAVLARGARPVASAAPRGLAYADLVVDAETHRVSRGGEMIKLTPTELRLLMALLEEPGRILSPEHLVRKVWGEQYAAESDYVRRYVWYLRQKIERNPDDPEYIHNERNVGYYLGVRAP